MFRFAVLVLTVFTLVTLMIGTLGQDDDEDKCSTTAKCEGREEFKNCTESHICCHDHRYSQASSPGAAATTERKGTCVCCKEDCDFQFMSQAGGTLAPTDEGSYKEFCPSGIPNSRSG